MSNPDLPGSYWQDQDESAYQPGHRARSADAGRADRWAESRDWPGNGGRRDSRPGQYDSGYRARDSRASGNGRPAGNGHHAAGYSRENGISSRGEAQTWSGIMAGRSRGSHAQGPAQSTGGGDWTGRLSQTADELRSRLGLRGSGSGRSDQARFDATGGRGQGGRGQGGYGQGSRGQGSYGQGGRGQGSYGGDSRTALRQGTGYRSGDRTSRLSEARTALRSRYDALSARGGGGHGGGGRRGGGRGGRWDGPPGGLQDRFMAWLRSGSWWRHWSVKKVIGLLGACVAGVVLLMVGGFFYLYASTSVPTVADLTANWQSSIVYFAGSNGQPGQEMGHFDPNQNGVSVDRMQLTTSQVPVVMGQAMAAAEDRHFYTEGGVSLTGLMRATYQDLFGHGNLQGGSTITMQYAKNYFQGVNTGQNLSTKLKEIIIAMKLGHSKSKSWVMTNYLNLVPFGPPQDTGLGAAAENYFNINLTSPGATLTLAQAAMLASLPNSPGFFDPHPSAGAGYTALVARYNSVLLNMQRDGSITAAQESDAAKHFPTLTPPSSGNGWTGDTGYLMSMVEQQMEAPTSVGGYGLTKFQVETGGYRIYTTFRPDMVAALAQAVVKEQNRMAATGHPFQSYDRIGAVLEDPKTGAIWAVYGGPGYGLPQAECNAANCQFNYAEAAEQVGSSFKPYVLSEAVNQGMNVFTSQLDGYSPIYIPVLNNPVNYSQLETMPSLTAPPAGFPPNPKNASTYASGNTYYFTFNEQSENSGKPLPVNVAAAISSDPAFEDLAHRDGVDNVINMAKAFGVGQNAFVQPCSVLGSDSGNQAQIIADCNDLTGPVNGLIPNLGTSYSGKRPSSATPGSVTIALGENPLTPVEQATTFATLADDGLYHTPHVIASVTQGDATLPDHITATQVLSPAAAADVDYALSFDNNMSGATGESNVSFRRGGVIGKTGTLGTGDNASEAWFIGATPSQAALSVALFTNLPATQNLNNMGYVGGMPGSQGGGWPATIWNAFMTSVYSGTPWSPLFPTVNGAPFATWLQAQPAQQDCTQQQWMQWLQSLGQGGGQSQTQPCQCPKNAPWCNNQPGNGGNPNPGQSQCFGFQCGGGGGGGNGHGGNPSPTPSASTAALVYGSPRPAPGGLPLLTGLTALLAEEAAVTRPAVVT